MIRNYIILHYLVEVNDALGQLSVYHDGDITWDTLQAIKNTVWGEETRAIEVYPAQSQVVNNVSARHLWRLGKDDFCPDLLGEAPIRDTLEDRFNAAWAEARAVFTNAADAA